MSKILEKALSKIQDSIVGRFDSGIQPGEENILDPKIVPDPEEGEAYVTHRHVNEQDDEEETPPEEGEAGAEDMGDMGGEEGMDTGMGDMGGGMGMPGEEDKPKDMDELGKRYELLKLRSYVSQAIDLFKTMINNIELFNEKIEEIIVVFYEFLKYTYAIMKKFYEEKEKEK